MLAAAARARLAATDDLAEDQAVVEVTGTVQRYLLTELQEIADVFGPGYDDPAALEEFARENLIVVDSIARLGFEIVPKPCSAEMLAEAMERVSPSSSRPAAARGA